ncbi:MAG: MraY family glycosyltransferase [Verrucomicrobiota bacterium]
MGEVWNITTVFATTFLVVVVGILLIRRFWRLPHGVDGGDGVRKLQEKPVLRVGGLPLFLAFLVSYFVSMAVSNGQEAPELTIAFVVLGSVMFVMGFCDDLFHLSAKVKLLVQVAVGVAAYSSGMRIECISNPFGEGVLQLGGFSLVLTIAWFVALPNLINLIDGMDGLAGGISLFLCATLAALGMLTGNAALVILCVGLVGALTGFLLFNLPPAKIYMGDGGAYLLGFVIAASSLISSNKGAIFGALLVVVIALGFPILDTVLAITRRALAGLPLMAPDARHLHHRLITLGFSKRTILLVLYGIVSGLSLLGLSVFVSQGYMIPIAGMVGIVVVFGLLRLVGLPHTVGEARRVAREIIALRKEIRYAYALSQVLAHELDRIDSAERYWNLLRESLAKVGIFPRGSGSGGPNREELGACLVSQKISEEHLWEVLCLKSTRESRQWNRVVRCFLPALMDGVAKWGEYPPHLGISGPEKGDSSIHHGVSMTRPAAGEGRDPEIEWEEAFHG